MEIKKTHQDKRDSGNTADSSTLLAELKAREARLTAFFEGAPVPTFVIDANHRVRRWNRALEVLSGIPAKEMLGTKNQWQAFYQEERPCLVDLLMEGDPALISRWYGEKIIQPGLIDEAMEATDFFPNLGSGGKWLRFTASVIRSNKGILLGAVETLEDITEKKEAEAALRASEARFRLFSQMAPVGVVIEDHAEKNLYVSQKFTEMLGYTRDDIPSAKAWWPLAFPDAALREKVRREWAAEVAKAKNTNFEINPFESPVTCKNGKVKDIEFRMRIADRLNFITLTDITDRKQAAAEQEKLQAQLIQAQKMESVGRLAGGVAHDFNNMLSVILGHTELAMDQTDPANFLYDDLREIYQAAERSADLTRQLLAFARKQTIAPRVMDLNETVEGMLRMLRRLIGEDVDLVWEPEAHVWPVKMDPSQVDQILANLCVNAKDALEGHGKIVIETGTRTLDAAYCHDHAGFLPGDYVVLAVSDNGCGMSPDIQANLFEPFYTTKEVGRGTGLGLATIYGIVKQNNGFINVYSEPGTGTTFRIYIPRHETAAAESIPALPAAVDMRGDETILLVEDEPAILKMTRAMLTNMGYRVMTAESPAAALRMSETLAETVHLLLTDVVMPGMNGRELAERLVRLWPELKVLYISGYTANAIAHFGVLDKGLNFIQKPFSATDLQKKVRQALLE